MSHIDIRNGRDNFVRILVEFFSTLFGHALTDYTGGILLSVDNPPAQYIYRSTEKAAESAYEFNMLGKNVFYGVNPRIWSGDRRWRIRSCISHHVTVKYGNINRKKRIFQSREEAINNIFGYSHYPTILVDTGFEFQCIWVLDRPFLLNAYGRVYASEINSNLTLLMKGDTYVSGPDGLLQVPGTIRQRKSCNPGTMYISYNNDPYKNASEYFEDMSIAS
jgi:hypothetical protein